MVLKILQINAQGSKNVAADLRILAQNKGIDILLKQEPYIYMKKVKGYGISNRVLQCSCMKVPKSAIVVLNAKIEVTQITQFTDSHYVCAYIGTEEGGFYVASVYCQYSHNIDSYVNIMESMLEDLGRDSVIIEQ